MKRFASMLMGHQHRFTTGRKSTRQCALGRLRSNKTAVNAHFLDKSLTKTYYLPNTTTTHKATETVAKKLENFIRTSLGLSAFNVDVNTRYIPSVPNQDPSTTIGSIASGAPIDVFFGKKPHEQPSDSPVLDAISSLNAKIQHLEHKQDKENQLIRKENQLIRKENQPLKDKIQLLDNERDQETKDNKDRHSEYSKAFSGDKQAMEQIHIRFLLDTARSHVLKITGYSRWFNLCHKMSEEQLADMLEKGPEFAALSLVAPREAASMIYSGSNVYRRAGNKAAHRFSPGSVQNALSKIEGRDRIVLMDIFTIASATAND